MSDAIDPITGYNPENEVRSITVEIDAPVSVVWDILTDLPRYGEWNPFCIKAVSTLEIGAPIEMHLTNFWNGEIAINTEYVCANDTGRMLSWELKHAPDWPYQARRDQVVASLGPERCSYVSINAFYGDTGFHVMRFAGPWVKVAFDNTARALKARAEAMWAGR